MQSGGRVEADSTPGVGTRFEAVVPGAGRPLPPAPAPEPAKPPVGQRGVVLLVEDEQLVRALANRLLVRDGYTVIEAANGVEALEVARRHAGPIDLLVCDVVMPAMGGPELAERLLETFPALPVLFMSGYNETAVAGYTRIGVEVDLMPKPFTPSAFSARVAAALARPGRGDARGRPGPAPGTTGTGL